MRIRDAVTRPVLLATVGALALGTITAITITGTVAPPPESFRCVELKAPAATVESPTVERRFSQPPPTVEPPSDSCDEWFSGRRQDMPPPRCTTSD